MSGHYEAPIREPLIIGHKTYHDITEDIARPIEETKLVISQPQLMVLFSPQAPIPVPMV